MAVQQPTPRLANPAAVHGLEQGRERARRRASRRRAKNTIVAGVMFVLFAVIVCGTGYYVWQFYIDEQERDANDTPALTVPRDAEEIMDDLQDNPRWNGPGAPAFGVGDDQP